MRKVHVLTLTVIVVAAVVFVPTVTTAQVAQPNVVLIVVDDVRWDESGLPTGLKQSYPAGYLPTIRALAADGFWASNAFNTNSLCCPARATILTGRYSHGTGVWRNAPPYGGFASFRPNEGSTLATWFDAAGYRTALVGKYLNGYNNTSYIPPGWDHWAVYKGATINHYNYTLTVNGTTRSYGSTAADYATDVLAGYAERFVADTSPEAPLFLMFTPYAPHAPYRPPPRYNTLFSSYTPVLPPNVAEADVSDKPAWVRALKRTNGGWVSKKREQMEMLMAVDDAVARIRSALATEGRLEATIFLFVSDNGMSGGSHRWTSKKSPWDEALRMPLIAAGPDVAAGTTSDQLIANIDIAATLSDLTGVPVPATDGVSFAGLLAGGNAPIREDFLFERMIDPAGTKPPTYCGVRSLRYKYIRYANGERELYDLAADPWELTSKHAAPAYDAIEEVLLARLKELCQPPPPGLSF